MPTHRRKKAEKLKKTVSPPVELKIIESDRLSSHSDESSNTETTTTSQKAAEPQGENRSEDSNSVDLPSCAFKKPEPEAPSQETDKYEEQKTAGSPYFLLRTHESKVVSQKSQTRSPPHKVDECGDSGEIGSPLYLFQKPGTNVPHKSQTTGPSQKAEECLNVRTDSSSFEFKKPKTRKQSLKAGKCGDSTREDSPSPEVKKQWNKASFEQEEDYRDLQNMATLQNQFTDPHIKECGSSVKPHKTGVSFQKEENSDDASKRDSLLREFKRLKQRDLELDNERAALTEAIGNETGLTTIMQQLHEYNLIKDTAQLIIGSLSNVLNVPIAQLHQELNLTFQ